MHICHIPCPPVTGWPWDSEAIFTVWCTRRASEIMMCVHSTVSKIAGPADLAQRSMQRWPADYQLISHLCKLKKYHHISQAWKRYYTVSIENCRMH